MRRGPENIYLKNTIERLRRSKKAIWRKVSEMLNCPRRKRIAVNLSKVNRYYKEGKIVVIPGKVLADEPLKSPVTIVAWSASKKALKEIEKAGGKFIRVDKYFDEHGEEVGDLMILR
ncbi:MAG: 50S ribosomal protein L18e [Candidatus Micrarchaeota archaeon]|nr:50S ribosomal protein L18e [Candidatus Micrarchaeota archaeon]